MDSPLLKSGILENEANMGANSFLLEKTPFSEGRQTIFGRILPPLKMIFSIPLDINPCAAELG